MENCVNFVIGLAYGVVLGFLPDFLIRAEPRQRGRATCFNGAG
jgi:hypothetical protein